MLKYTYNLWRYNRNMDKFTNQFKDINKMEHKILNDFDVLHQNILNVEEIIDSTGTHLDTIEKEFIEQTQLDKDDIPLLFAAIALQSCRWIFQPKMDLKFSKTDKTDRHSSSADGQKEKKIAKEKAKKNIYHDNEKYTNRFPTKQEILLNNVPYDAMKGTEHIKIPGVTDEGKNICGKNHHSATMGHDPLLGYLFGTMNIITRTITFKTPNLITNPVKKVPNSNDQYVIPKYISPLELLYQVKESLSEDYKRIVAAFAKQIMHLQSDKYSKQGLPIPFLSPEKAQNLLNKGWNSNELEKLVKYICKNTGVIGIQAFLSLAINCIIEFLYILTHDDYDINKVKCRKLITYSNVIANSSNIIFSIIKKNLCELDLGGFIVTIHRIYQDKKVIGAIQQEFIDSNISKIIDESQIQFNSVDIYNNFEKGNVYLDIHTLKDLTFPQNTFVQIEQYRYFLNFKPIKKSNIAKTARVEASHDALPLFKKLDEILDREKTKLQVDSDVKSEIIVRLKEKYNSLLTDYEFSQELMNLLLKLKEIQEMENESIAIIDSLLGE